MSGTARRRAGIDWQIAISRYAGPENFLRRNVSAIIPSIYHRMPLQAREQHRAIRTHDQHIMGAGAVLRLAFAAGEAAHHWGRCPGLKPIYPRNAVTLSELLGKNKHQPSSDRMFASQYPAMARNIC